VLVGGHTDAVDASSELDAMRTVEVDDAEAEHEGERRKERVEERRGEERREERGDLWAQSG
jgi:hypothetical protein